MDRPAEPRAPSCGGSWRACGPRRGSRADIAARRGLLPAGGVGDVVAALPALAVAGVIWSILRYLSEEEDEYRRLLMAKAFIAATGLTLVITTAWGFVQNFAGAPMVSLMYVFVLFIACQAVAGTIVQWRAR